MAAGLASDDPLWQMPLWAPYEADAELEDRRREQCQLRRLRRLDHRGAVPQALRAERQAWVHLDIYAWAPEPRPGRPFGGTDQGIRSVYGVLKQRYS